MRIDKVNIPELAMALNAAENMSFDVDLILEQFIQVALGQSDGRALPAQLLNEVADAVRAFKDDPVGTGTDVGMGIFATGISFKLLGLVGSFFGIPKQKTFKAPNGKKFTIKYAL